MADPFAADLARKGFDVDDSEDDAPPSFLTKGAAPDPFARDLARKGYDDVAPSEPATSVQFPEPGELGRLQADLKTARERPPSWVEKVPGAVGAVATDAVDAATLGGYSRLRNAAYSGIDAVAGTNLEQSTRANDEGFNAEHPFVAGLGKGIGYAAPIGAAGLIGRGVTTAGAAALDAAPAAVSQAVRNFAVTNPLTVGLAKHAVTGAAASGLTALGEDVTAGVPLRESLEDAGGAAIAGGAIGAGLGTAADAIVKSGGRITDAAKNRVIKTAVGDIVGNKKTGKAIDTDARKMARAIEPIRAELATPEGLEIADTARLDPDEGLVLVKDKLREITKERAPDYALVDKASKGGGVRAGDFVKHLEDSADALEATGKGKDAQIAGQLRNRIELLKKAKEWGGGSAPPIDPNAPFNDDYTNGQYLDLMTKAGHRDQAMTDLAANQPAKGWNPDAIVPVDKLRGIVTDMQSTAYDAMGGINGTNAFQKAVEVAHVGEKYLNAKLDEAAKADPKTAEAVDRIREMNKRVNAYKTIETALKTRASKQSVAEVREMSETDKSDLAHGAALLMMHPKAAAAAYVAKTVVPGALDVADRTVSRALAGRSPIGEVASPAAVARLIKAARGGGTSRRDLEAQAETDGVPADVAGRIIVPPVNSPRNDREKLARQALSDPQATAREKARAIQIIEGP